MRRITVTLTICLFIWFALESSAQPMPDWVGLEPEPARTKSKPTIAVTTFENLSAYLENGWVAMSFSEALTVKLNRLYERFRVVERIRVYEVIREQGFDPEKLDRLEATKQRDIGSLLGANFLILGSVSLQGLADEPKTKLLANMRTVDVQTGEIKEATSVSGQMQEIFDLEIQLAFAFLKQVGVDITVAEEQQISIKETESLLAEKYYNFGNQHLYDGNLEAAEAWYARAVELLEGGYYREAALRRVEVLRQQKVEATTEADKQKIIDKMQKRIDQIYQRRAEADEMLFEQAELLTEVGQYEQAIEAYQLYLERAKPWQPVKWKTAIEGPNQMVVGEKAVYLLYAVEVSDTSSGVRYFESKISALDKESGALKWKFKATEANGPASIMTVRDFAYLQVGDVLYALDEETGEERWKFEVPQEDKLPIPNDIVIVHNFNTFNIADGLVYFRLSNGILYALAGDTGQLKWQFDTIPGTRGFDLRLQFLFGIDLKFQMDLDNGNFSEDLRRAFENHGFTFPKDAMVSIKAEDSEWIITMADKEPQARYVIKKEEDILNVCHEYPNPLFLSGQGVSYDSMFNLAPPVISDGTIYINKYENPFCTLTALRAETGEALWTAKTPIISDESPIVAAGTVYVPALSGVVAVAAETGKLKWQSDPFKNLTLLAFEGDILYALSDGHELVAISAATGEVRFRWRELGEFGGVNRKTLLANGILLCRLHDHRTIKGGLPVKPGPDKLYALSADTGKKLWEFGEEDISAPIVHNRTVYFGSEKGFYAVAMDTGEIVWQTTLDFGPLTNSVDISTPILQNNILHFGSEKGFYAVAMDTGKIQWQVTDIGRIHNYTVTADGMPYIIASDIIMSGDWVSKALFALNPKAERYKSSLDETNVFFGLGRAKRLIGRYDEAIGDFQRILSSRLDFIRSYPELALCYEGMGNWREATRTWDKYLALNVKQGAPIPKEAEQHLWELAGVRWHGPGAGWQPGSPIITNDTIYLFSANDDYVYALNPWTGQIRWRFNGRSHWQFKGRSNGIAQSHDRVIVVSEGIIHALDTSTGEVQWKFQGEIIPVDYYNLGPPVASDGVVYLGLGNVWYSRSMEQRYVDGRLYALSAQTGELLWKFELSRPKENLIPFGGFKPSVLMVRDKVYWSPGMRHLYAISKENGALKWQFDRGELPSYEFSASAPVVTGGMVYVTGTGVLSAINTETGNTTWKTQIPGLDSSSPLAVSNGFVYAGGSNVIYALTADTGEIKWQSSKGALVKTLVADSELLYACDAVGAVSAFAADSGEAKWAFSGDYILKPVVILTDQEIYIGGNWDIYRGERSGIVYSLSRENAKLRWKFHFANHRFADSIRDTGFLPFPSLTIANEMLYVSTVTGLYAFDLAKIDQLLALGKKWWSASATEARQNAVHALMADGAPLQLNRILAILSHYEGSNSYNLSDVEFLELKKMGKDVAPVLIAYWKVDAQMKPEFVSVRDDIIQNLLMEFGDASIIPDMEEIVAYNVNFHAAQVLARLDGNSAIPRLLEILRASAESYVSDDYKTHRYDIMEALATLKAKEAAPILSQRLSAAKERWEKGKIAKYLGDIGDPSAIPVLQEALRQMKKVAIDINADLIAIALCQLGDKMGVETLIHSLEVERVKPNSWHSWAQEIILKTLVQYTGQDFQSGFDKPEEHLSEIAKIYRAWWNTNKDKLVWSEKQKRFVLP